MKLADDIQRMMTMYTKLLKLCHEALAEDFDQDKRDHLREVLSEYIDFRDKEPK